MIPYRIFRSTRLDFSVEVPVKDPEMQGAMLKECRVGYQHYKGQ